MSIIMPPKSKVTTNEILLPSTLPSLIGIRVPSGPTVKPVSIAPSALNSWLIATSPFGVLIEPVQLPSTSAASAGVAISNAASRNAQILISRSSIGAPGLHRLAIGGDGGGGQWGRVGRRARLSMSDRPAPPGGARIARWIRDAAPIPAGSRWVQRHVPRYPRRSKIGPPIGILRPEDKFMMKR